MSFPIKRHLALLTLALLLGAAAGAIAYSVWQQMQAEMRPDFTLPDLEGEPRSISEWDGKLIALNFWASWCPPCVKEIPLFNALQEEYGDRGLQFVGVAVERRENAAAFAEEIGLGYPSMQGEYEAMQVAAAYGSERGLLPYTVIIDRNGRIIERLSGEVTRDMIEPLIREKLGD
ncbi:MAG: TlpA family protein disulfide reductase [Ectothiorhodospiraceae bacterium]|nr:TlpA family protein disulfide reductase [Ectothiorhodospiraceae bacterium]MCH8506151.1 TlpA family protein disulfide reductase [Ectothiorhodospiraceae bacterium]